MPIPLKENQNISVAHRYYEGAYQMPVLSMAKDHYNIGFVINGTRKCITPTGSYTYGAGDIAVMAPYIYHQTVSLSNDPVENVLIKFTPDFVKPFIEEYGEAAFSEIYNHYVYHFSPENSERIKGMFLDMVEEYDRQISYTSDNLQGNREKAHLDFILQGMLFRIFDTIINEHIFSGNDYFFARTLSDEIFNAIVYMESQYNKNITLEEVARTAGMSVSHFSRTFHRELGQKYSTYLENIRFKHVLPLLSNTDMSIMEIAAVTGFCNGNYLCERFKKNMGMSPTNYRKTEKT